MFNLKRGVYLTIYNAKKFYLAKALIIYYTINERNNKKLLKLA